MFQAGDTINNCYVLHEKLGENDVFSTWRAKALYSPNDFSLTFFTFSEEEIADNTFEQFQQVFFTLNTFQSPYIHTPFEFDESQGIKYLSFPWISGYSLREALSEQLINDYSQIVNISINLLRALSELERIGLRHNCLSPRSVVLETSYFEYGLVRLRNVGFSPILASLPNCDYWKRLEPYRRKPQAGDRGHEQDLYAAGILIEEMLTSINTEENLSESGSLRQLSRNMQEQPEAFDSVVHVLNQLLQSYPGKQVVDLIQEHIASTGLAEKSNKKLLQTIENRYTEYKNAAYEKRRTRIRELESKNRMLEELPEQEIIPETSLNIREEVEELEPAGPNPEIEETPSQASRTTENARLLTKTLNAVRRFFRRGGKKRFRLSKKPESFEKPPQSDRSEANLPTVDGDLKHTGEPDEKNRVATVVQQLTAHFTGLFKFRSRSEVSTASSTTAPSPDFEENDTAPQTTEIPEVNTERPYTSGTTEEEYYRRQRKTPGSGTELGSYMNQQAQAKNFSARSREQSNSDYALGEGPDYSTLERRDSEDASGPSQNIDWNESRIRKDRETPQWLHSHTDEEGETRDRGQSERKPEDYTVPQSLPPKLEQQGPKRAASDLHQEPSSTEDTKNPATPPRPVVPQPEPDTIQPVEKPPETDDTGQGPEQPMRPAKKGFFARLLSFLQRIYGFFTGNAGKNRDN
ncbi:MAG: hypothetical protein K9L68_03860 [Spirochaetales bacterium]|nr:hypothetical protein [Spirochaetales bacterium]MCF7937715.1 hypothetical protein [Spirochaetales bacterium]